MVERPGDDRAGARAAAGADRDLLAFGPLDDVGDDQEIPGKAHPDDRPELEFEPFAVGLCGFLLFQPQSREPGVEPGHGGAAQRSLLVDAFAAREGRQDRLAGLRNKGTALRYNQRVVAGLGEVGKDLPHLCRRPKIMGARQPLALRICHDRALRDAEQRVMRLIEVAVGEINIVGRDQRQPVAIRQLDEARLGPGLLGRAMARQLDIEPARKCRRECAQHRLGGIGLALGEKPADGTLRAARQAEQPLAGAGQIAARDRRLGRRFTGEIGLAHQP